MLLRPYQTIFEQNLIEAFQTYRYLLGVLPTGGGKTYTFSDLLSKFDCYKAIVAHRQELVAQISLSLGQYGIPHRIIAPSKTRRWIIGLHVQEFGTHFVNQKASAAVIGVDTLTRGSPGADFDEFRKHVRLWVIDEAHHCLKNNKWGKAAAMFPKAFGLGVTATPVRADGKGLGAHHDGIFEHMVLGPTMRELIDQQYLCDYRIFAPESDFDTSHIPLGSTGDFTINGMRQAARESHIVGDVVKHYLRIASGKQGVTFATDVETATDIANSFRESGVKAEVLHAKVKDALRVDITRRFRNKEIQQIVNVDILGEGFDVPGIEVVSKARPTKSFSLYAQQFGRALRTAEGKTHAIIIDHVRNVLEHGLPDARNNWTLDRRGSKKKEKDLDLVPMRVCPECEQPYVRTLKECPFCGHYPEPPGRSKPEFVDGDLTELDPEVLARMRAEIMKIDEPAHNVANRAMHAGAHPKVYNSMASNHRKRQDAQHLLRESIAWWRAHLQCEDSEAYRRFYFRFGVDVAKAQTLGTKEAETLAININKSIDALVNKR